MITKRIDLGAGVCLNMVQTERFKTGCFSFNLLCPLQEETASLNALIPSVLLRGCVEYPDMQSVSHRLDELYGATIGTLVRKKGEVQSIGLYADFLEDRYANDEPIFEETLNLLEMLLFDPCLHDDGFFEEFVSGEKQNLLNTIASRINNKRSYAAARLLKNMCAGEAYSVARLGEKEPLEQVEPKQLYAHWKHLLSTLRIELFYLGQQPEECVLEQVRKLIKRLPERKMLAGVETKVVITDRPVQMVEESLDITQGKLCIGFRTPITVDDARYPAMMLLNTIFGAGMTSKLFTVIREEQSLCYYASSSLDRLKGIMMVASGIEFSKYEIARDGILQQLELCKQAQISDEELISARNYLISALRTYNDSPGRLDDYMIGQAIAGRDETVDDLIEQLQAVKKEQIVEAAKTLILDTVYFLRGEE